MTEIEFLNHVIKAKGIKQKDVADKLGITTAAMWDRINDRARKSMSVSTFAAMLDALGYDLVAVPRGAADGLPDAWKAPTGTGE